MKFFFLFSWCVVKKPRVVEGETGEFTGVSYSVRARKKKSRSNSGSGTQWRPSLRAISEENQNTTSRVGQNKAEQKVRCCRSKLEGETRPKRKIRSYYPSDDNEYQRTSIPTVIPSFSPGGFLF